MPCTLAIGPFPSQRYAQLGKAAGKHSHYWAVDEKLLKWTLLLDLRTAEEALADARQIPSHSLRWSSENGKENAATLVDGVRSSAMGAGATGVRVS